MSAYIGEGKSVTLTAGGAVSAYSLVSYGGSGATAAVGVAVKAAVSGEDYTVAKAGRWWVAKTAGQAWAVGDPLYLASGAATTTKGTNPYIGRAAYAAASAATEGAVDLADGGSDNA